MQESYITGRDELFGQVNNIVPNIAAILGYDPIVVYQGVESEEKLPTDKLWMRVSQKTVDESQSSLRGEFGGQLKRRYTSYGLLFVQIFISKTNIQDYQTGLIVANMIKNAYRGKQTENCIWFNNVRIQELDPETAWYRVNVVAEYQYDEIG